MEIRGRYNEVERGYCGRVLGCCQFAVVVYILYCQPEMLKVGGSWMGALMPFNCAVVLGCIIIVKLGYLCGCLLRWLLM